MAKKFTIWFVKRQAVEVSARDEDEAYSMADDMVANSTVPENWEPVEIDDVEPEDDDEDED